MDELHEKYNRLKASIAGYGSVAIAFSGGVDSTFLLQAAHEVLGDHAVAVTAAPVFVPSRELEAAQALLTVATVYLHRHRHHGRRAVGRFTEKLGIECLKLLVV